MANVIRIKRSTGAGAPTTLANAELAYSEGADSLFIGVGTGGSGGSATTVRQIASGTIFSSQTAKYVWAAPTGAAGAPSFRQLSASDISGLTSGTVTSVGLSLPSIFTVSNSPVTSTGTLTGTLASQSANKVFASPAVGSGAPSFRELISTDMPASVAQVGANNTFASGATQTFAGTANVSGALQLGGVAVTATAAELNLVDGSSAGSVVNGKAVIYSGTGTISAAGYNVSSGPTLNSVGLNDAGGFLVVGANHTLRDSAGNLALDFSGSTISIDNNLFVGGTAEIEDLTIAGTLTVNGEITYINSTTVQVDDKNLELGTVSSPTDAGASGGGITLKGTTDKTFNWIDATDSWTSSENIEVATGKSYRADGAVVLTKTSLGSTVVSSSLTSVGTIATGVWSATAIAVAKGGTGATDAATARTNLGLGSMATASTSSYQPVDAELTAIAGLTSAANKLPYFTGSGTAAVADLSAFGRSLIDDADVATARSTLGLGTAATTDSSAYQAADTELAAIAGLTSAADRLPYFTGAGTASLATFSSFGRTLVDDADAAAARTTLGLGTMATASTGSYQPIDATLTALAGVATVADRLIYATAADTFTVTTLTAFGRSLLDDADAATARATLGLGTMATAATSSYQPIDATLTALAGVTTVADRLIYATGADTFTVTTLTAFGRSLIDDADAATARATLALGTIATQNSNAVSISGGTIDGITIDGGTWS